MKSRILSFESWRRGDAPAARAPRVLIVDDDDLFRTFVERVLREEGYFTAVARDGEEALALAATGEPFDLLLTDEMMPCIPGHQLARYMRSRQPNIGQTTKRTTVSPAPSQRRLPALAAITARVMPR